MTRNTRRNTVINPLSGRAIQIGGSTYNQLIVEAYDYINGELVRRESAPPLPRRRYYLNIDTGRSILIGSRRYHELINAGWEILVDHYLIPPDYDLEQTLDMIRETGHEITQRTHTELLAIDADWAQRSPITYEGLMDVHGEGLAELNISLCQECFYPLKSGEGNYCHDCQP